MVIDDHELQTFKIMIVVLLLLMLSFDFFVPTRAHSLVFWTSGCPNIPKRQFDVTLEKKVGECKGALLTFEHI